MALECVVLSPEILLMIFSFLSTSDIRNLRLVSWDYHNCASQYLIRILSIASDPRSFQLWKNVYSDDLFRRGISRVVYHTGPTYTQPPQIEAWNYERSNSNASKRFVSNLAHCYDVYSVLEAGLPQFPMVKEVMITDQNSTTRLEATSAVEWDINRWRRKVTTCEDDTLSLFILLRALAEANLRLKCFDLHMARFIPGCTQGSLDHRASSKQKMPTYLFQRCVSTAVEVFKTLRELYISTCGPDPESLTPCYAKVFEENLMALLLAAGPGLEILRLVVKNMPLPLRSPSPTLFSGRLFKISRIYWPLLSSIELRGVDIDGSDLVSFIKDRGHLSKLSLQNIYLVPSSLAWTAILDNLCAVFEVHFPEAPMPGRKGKGETNRSAAWIEIDLDHVYEPWDEGLHAGLSLRTGELREFFERRERNPLRVSYQSFLCRDEG